MESQWKNKKVAFLGDSLTDKAHVGTTKNYWQFLAEYLHIQPLVYGINGWQWSGALQQAQQLLTEQGTDVDAIFIMMGTNDFNSNVPLGEWWTYQDEETNANGVMFTRKRRIFSEDSDTLKGRINKTLRYLKENFPLQQIIILTPIHRGFATFGPQNVQPEETFPNGLGLYFEVYVEVIKEAGGIWSVPVIDLYALSALNPLLSVHGQFFHDSQSDRLHPNIHGHQRIAQTLQYQMLALPATFR